jgi:Glycosyl transferase family 2
MTEMPHVSIIINNHNYGRFLSEAIDSALMQSYVNTEVIVVDDGSTDNSRKIIERYGDRFTTIAQKNGGQGAAYNTGFAASRSDFVCFLDADDTLHPNAMTEAVAAFDDTRIVKIEWQMEVIDATGRKNGSVVPEKPLPSDLREQTISNGPFYDWWITAPGSGTCYGRSMLDRVLPMPTEANRHGADAYLTVLAPICGSVRRLNSAFGCYRQHEKNNYFGRALTNDRLKDYLRRFGNYSTAVQKHLATQGVDVDVEDWKRRNFNYLWPSRLLKAKEEIERVIPAGAGYILIDNNELASDNLVPGRCAVPFIERNGTYWGPPPDEKAALVEMERLTSKGIVYVVLWWTAFWWLTEYFVLNKYLHEHATRLIENDALKIFQLCRPNLESQCASPS